MAAVVAKRPYRDTVRHRACGVVSAVAPRAAREFQADPAAFTTCYCSACKAERPATEFTWAEDGKPVGK